MARRFAARDDRGALFAAGLDVLEHPILLLARHERTHLRGRIETRPELDALRGAADAFDDLVEDLSMHVQARARAQTWPALKKIAPAAPPITVFASASGSTMTGDLPPSSSDTRFSVSVACLLMSLPTAVDPVNAILSTPGCFTSAAPVVSP